jgi:hypothetical protein
MKPRPWRVHPIWRGIGCILIILIPFMSYLGAILLVRANQANHWVKIPAELMKTIKLPFVGSAPHLFATLAGTLVLMAVGFGVLMILYAALYRVSGPSMHSPLDAPPERYIRRKKR